ncbi:MAG TPA: penicillin-binding transpeptidase domain-containing protein [Pirellulales bacterium]|nr:penicillin-binding transpeptidase domain-containing protein [Pirellulales bacterium]
MASSCEKRNPDEKFDGGDARGRLGWLLAIIAALAAVVLARFVALECFYGAAYRAEAARPIERTLHVPGVRGRILARDGTVLAYDREMLSLAVEYRYLEQPPDPRWLEMLARRRLPRQQRRRREDVAAETLRARHDRDDLHRRLAQLCGRTLDDLRRRAAAIQGRVTQIAEQVNQRRQERFMAEIDGRGAARPAESRTWSQALNKILFPPAEETPPSLVAVVEQLDHHVVFQDVSLEVVAEVESHPELYPGVRIISERRRTYPAATLAAHVLGHLGSVGVDDLLAETHDEPRSRPVVYAAGDVVGRLGAERRFEPILHAAAGAEVERSDRGGRRLEIERLRAAGVGRDLVLTIEPALQRTAESLLDAALVRRFAARRDTPTRCAGAPASGGAIVVLDVENGAILASASAPRFDPNAFSGDSEAVTAILSAPGNALFDRATRMALPPGSVFKALTAVALLETGGLTADEPFECQGYLHEPGAQRCGIFRQFGMGHGEVTLVDALARSCNVYFFHHAGEMGPGPLVAWAARFGFGRPTGVDLPDEAAGSLPCPGSRLDAGGPAWRIRDTQALAIGQGELTATPLQVARLMAAIANGGRLVTPHVAARVGLPESAAETFDDDRLAALLTIAAPREIEGLSAATLEIVRDGLAQVVAASDGTAHHTAFLETIAIAGKTGTAETGAGDDHAWFAGYAPAESPRIAFVVVLEHTGNGGEAAGPVVKRLVMRLEELGCL